MEQQLSYCDVFTIRSFVKSYAKSVHGVSWKHSTQKYSGKCVVKITKDKNSMARRKLPKHITRYTITLYERGKKRVILPIHVKDRIIQKALCDEFLVNELSKHLIYTNGASMVGKGTQFSRKFIDKYIRKAVIEYDGNFYVLYFDFKSFFGSIDHGYCNYMLKRFIRDKETVDVTMDILKTQSRIEIEKIQDANTRKCEMERLERNELKGMSLGSQVSQIIALAIPNDIDHYIKDKARMKYYIRHMDDGFVLAKTKEELIKLLDGITKICNRIKLNLNVRKTFIAHISKGFTFLKTKYSVVNGKLVKRMTRAGIVRERRKLKKLKTNGIQYDDAFVSFQSWYEHAKYTHSRKTRKKMKKLFKDLYGGDVYNGDCGIHVFQGDRFAEYRWCCE